jgi:transcriptional regulator with XRE-family HTH domain
MIERANGASIRAIRELSGISLRSFAARIGITASQMSRIETGGSPGSPATIRKIADALHVPREAIVTYDAAEAEPAGAASP